MRKFALVRVVGNFIAGGLLVITVGLLSNAQAIVLGDIQVKSLLGQPLKATISISELDNLVVKNLEVGLAGVTDYEKLGLQYPHDIKFEFQLIQEQVTSASYIVIHSARPVNDPFVNLLLKVTLPDGKLFKTYTFLLDPPPELLSVGSLVAEGAPEINQSLLSGGGEKIAQQDVAVRENAGTPIAAAIRSGVHDEVASKRKSVKRKTKKSLRKHSAKPVLKQALTISKNDPSVSRDSSEDMTALHEELIAKEKILEELNAQIVEMQAMIKALRANEQSTAHSSVYAASGVLATGGVVNQSIESGVTSIPVTETPGDDSWVMSWSILALLLFAMSGAAYYWYQKNRRLHGAYHGSHDLYPEFYSSANKPSPVEHIDDAVLMTSPMVEKTELSFISPERSVEMEFPSLMEFHTKAPELQAATQTDDAVLSGIASMRAEEIDFPVEPLEGDVSVKVENSEMFNVSEENGIVPEVKGGQTDESDLSFILPFLSEEAVPAYVVQEADKTDFPSKKSSMDILDYVDSASGASSSDDYALLFDENTFLKSENEKMTEQESIEVGKSDSEYIHEYLALLAIYLDRGDVKGFETLARQLKDIGDEDAFGEAAVMGRELDPANPLYH